MERRAARGGGRRRPTLELRVEGVVAAVVVGGVALARRVADEEGGDPAEVIVDVRSSPRRYKRDIPKFGKGQAVIKASNVEAVEVAGVPHCLTRHDI